MKIKEKILKFSKHKNCFIALLLLALLAFSFLGGLNGAKSAKIEVNALSAPQTKNLDLNGIRYTYQTSLSELKNSYGLFDAPMNSRFCQMHENTEGYNNIIFNASKELIYSTTLSQEQNQDRLNFAIEILNETFVFYKDNVVLEDLYYTNANGSENNKEVAFSDSFIGIDEITALEFKIDNYNKFVNKEDEDSFYSDFTGKTYTANFLYLSTDGANNTLLKSYAFSQPINYKFNIKQINGYRLALIYFAFETFNPLEENVIQSIVPDDYIETSTQGYVANGYITIDNINFINNENANIITFDTDFEQVYLITEEQERVELPTYKGNILLSENKYDEEMIQRFNNISTRSDLTYYFNGGCYLGGYFDNSPLVDTLTYTYTSPLLLPGGSTDNIDVDILGRSINENSNPKPGENNNLNQFIIMFDNNNGPMNNENFKQIKYFNQNRLIYLPKAQELRLNTDNYRGEGLSAQVEDVLYSVSYVGDVEEVEYNEKVEEDFLNLIKTTGLGAFIGLLIGLIFGNPWLGAAIGAGWGFLAGIIPLLIDGLQSIFGKNFLKNIYNFFKTITEFFANFVDTIINFLLSIITNPATLILIVIGAILYIIYYFQKK